MLESKKELVVLENSLSSASTKRSPFHLLSSIFSKKKSASLDSEIPSKPPESSGSSYNVSASDLSHRTDSWSLSGPDPLFLSPTSAAKRKNLKIELETLHLSRQDNPYLKQLERFSLQDDTLLDLDSLAGKALLQSDWTLDSLGDNEVDIHQHLVRSPPPQFPQNITHFMYSQANSPKRQASQNTTESEKNLKRELNPVQMKKEGGELDPGIRKVLEYQKSQLIAGLQHSLTLGQVKFGTMPAQVNASQSKWAQEYGSRITMSSQSVPHATSSLPGLNSCCFEAEQTCRRTTLGPIRIGRALSDSICHDAKLSLQKLGTNP